MSKMKSSNTSKATSAKKNKFSQEMFKDSTNQIVDNFCMVKIGEI